MFFPRTDGRMEWTGADDVRLRRWAAQITEQRRHSLRRRETDDAEHDVEQREEAVAELERRLRSADEWLGRC